MINQQSHTEEKNENEVKKEPNKSTTPKKAPGLMSRLTFYWILKVFYYGYKTDLEECDLVPTNTWYNSKILGDKLESKWLEEEFLAKKYGRNPSITRALIKSFGWSYIPGGIMQFVFTMLRVVTPLLFAQLLKFWTPDSGMTRQTAACYAVSMLLMNWVTTVVHHHGNLYCLQFGMKLRIATSSLLFRKTRPNRITRYANWDQLQEVLEAAIKEGLERGLFQSVQKLPERWNTVIKTMVMRMNNGSLGETTSGKVVNILSNDLQRFDWAMQFLHYVWIIPLQLALFSYLGYRHAGITAIIGLVALLIVVLPIQGTIGRFSGKVRSNTVEKTDSRIKLMNEIINGIQVIKMYAWELPFEKMVAEKRQIELKQVKYATFLRTTQMGFLMYADKFTTFTTIIAYVLLGNVLSANIIYPLQLFLSSVQINITFIAPLIVSFTAELFISMKRIQEFLVLPERPDLALRMGDSTTAICQNIISESNKQSTESLVKPISYRRNSETYSSIVADSGNHAMPSLQPEGDTAVELHDVSATWNGDNNQLALKKISLRIPKNVLCVVIGSVGSGKSSFLQLLLKELPVAFGNVSIFGSVSYASQDAWLFPDTVRENIIFGLPFEQNKYRKVCKVCALEKDFKQFPFGDSSLVGERGVSLSGGQRARVNLARAVYREADIYLLDDPLSAVDANVGRQLFEDCINGYLRGRTRILITHQIHFLKQADFIIVLNEGEVDSMGTFKELVEKGKNFPALLASLGEEQNLKDADLTSVLSLEIQADKKKRTLSLSTSENENLPEYKAQQLAAEERQTGSQSWKLFYSYILAGSKFTTLGLVVFFLIMSIAMGAGAEYWVSYWANNIGKYEEKKPLEPGLYVQVGPYTMAQYLTGHGVLVLGCILLNIVRILPYVHLCMSASASLHNRMFSTMLRAFMRFFDTNPSGRLLNRFTKDVGAVDDVLPRTLLDVTQIYGTVGSILILNAIVLYWTCLPSLVLLVIFGLFVNIYMRVAQVIKRLEGTAKSPVFAIVTSSLNGIATIRSNGAQFRLMNDFDIAQDIHTSAWNSYICGGSAFSAYFDIFGIIYLAIIIYSVLYLDVGGGVVAGTIGLAVTQTNTMMGMLQFGARMMVEFIAQLTSVERMLEYTNIETETNLDHGDIPTPETWPSEGNIVFDSVNLRYAPDEAPVLKNLNITIESGWKVGIVGRTGAGKTSLISALFRFAFIDGQINIDGLDTALVAKQNLRSKISIIPQEPVLFQATIRYNLDPFNIYTDDEIWRSLEQVNMKGVIPSLDFKVTEGGSNFSVGQRQLMCLARAVLRSNKILIMDEATANVDPQTDNFIQQTIRLQFASCTVLTIAHRLNTIMDSDKVLVMDAGQVVEFDHPYLLLLNPDGHFSSMVRETGEKNSAQLIQVAKQTYLQTNEKEVAR